MVLSATILEAPEGTCWRVRLRLAVSPKLWANKRVGGVLNSQRVLLPRDCQHFVHDSPADRQSSHSAFCNKSSGTTWALE